MHVLFLLGFGFVFIAGIAGLVLNLCDAARKADVFTEVGRKKIADAGYEKLAAERYRIWEGAAGLNGAKRIIKRKKVPLLSDDFKYNGNIYVEPADEIRVYGIKNGKEKLIYTYYGADSEIARNISEAVLKYNEARKSSVVISS